MKTATIEVVLPTEREDAEALPVEDIARVAIYQSVNPDAVGWTLINDIVPPATTLVVPDLESGTWHFQGVVVDTDGLESDPLVADPVIIPKLPPKQLASITITLS